jgi:protein-arginine kinase activator protein McsA
MEELEKIKNEIDGIRSLKMKAINKQDFCEAADLRDRERKLEENYKKLLEKLKSENNI